MGATVQRGQQAMGASLSVAVSLGAAIDTSKSLILIETLSSSSVPNAFQVEAYFPTLGASISSFNLDRYATGAGVTINWQVVTFDNATVTHINNIAFASGISTVGSTISIAALNKAFAYCTGRGNTTAGATGNVGFYKANITTTGNVNTNRGGTVTIAGQATTQIVEFTDSTTVEHQSMASTVNATTNITLSNAVNTAQAFVISTFTMSTGSLSGYVQTYISSATNVVCNRGNGTTGTSAAEIYVVSLPSGTVELDHQDNFVAGSTTINVPISNVGDTTQTFSLLTTSNSGTGTTFANGFMVDQLTSTTNDTITLQNTNNNKWYALQTVSFVAPAVNQQQQFMTMGVG